MMNNRKRYLRTRSLYLAAYLFVQGAELVGVEAQDQTTIFAFIRSADCETWSEEFQNSQEVLVDARRYANALEILECERQEELMKLHAGES
jgi:hypothetical protein